MASSVVKKQFSAPDNFYVYGIGSSGSTNNTLRVYYDDVSTHEHMLFAYGSGSAGNMIGFIAYSRKSSNVHVIKNFGDVAATITGSTNYFDIKISTYTSLYVFSRFPITMEYVST